jgi:predicted lipoprotein with Yx(FWY)xxD motif
MRSKSLAPLAAATAVALSAITIVACGSGSSTKHTTTGASAPAASLTPSLTSAPSGTVDLAKSSLGPILIDSQGRTLYLWQADTGAKSTCVGACAAAWPPLVTSGKPTAGNGVTTSLLGDYQKGQRDRAGDLQRPSSLPVRRRHGIPPDQRAGIQWFRRAVVRPLSARQPAHPCDGIDRQQLSHRVLDGGRTASWARADSTNGSS